MKHSWPIRRESITRFGMRKLNITKNIISNSRRSARAFLSAVSFVCRYHTSAPYRPSRSHIHPDDLFDLCIQFFDPSMDEDYKKFFAQCNQEDQDYYQKMQETLDNNIIIRQER